MGQSYQSNFTIQHIEEFIELIDKYLEAEGTIKNSVNVSEIYSFLGEDEVISFDKFYETFSKSLLENDTIPYDEIAETAEEQKRKREIAKFKQNTDRLI